MGELKQLISDIQGAPDTLENRTKLHDHFRKQATSALQMQEEVDYAAYIHQVMEFFEAFFDHLHYDYSESFQALKEKVINKPIVDLLPEVILPVLKRAVIVKALHTSQPRSVDELVNLLGGVEEMTPTLQAIKELEKEGKVTPAGSLGEIVLTSQEMSFVGDEVFDNNLFAPAPAGAGEFDVTLFGEIDEKLKNNTLGLLVGGVLNKKTELWGKYTAQIAGLTDPDQIQSLADGWDNDPALGNNEKKELSNMLDLRCMFLEMIGNLGTTEEDGKNLREKFLQANPEERSISLALSKHTKKILETTGVPAARLLPAGRTDIDKKSQEILISKLKEQLGNAVIEDWQTRIDTLDDFLTPAQEMLYQIENDVLLADDTRPNLLERLITQRVSLIRGAIAQVMLPEVDSFRGNITTAGLIEQEAVLLKELEEKVKELEAATVFAPPSDSVDNGSKDISGEVDPRLDEYLQSVDIDQQDFQLFSLVENKPNLPQRSSTNDILALNLLIQNVLGRNGHTGKVVRVGGAAIGVVAASPAPQVTYFNEKKIQKITGDTQGSYVATFTLVFPHQPSTELVVVYNTAQVYLASGKRKKFYTQVDLEIGQPIYLLDEEAPTVSTVSELVNGDQAKSLTVESNTTTDYSSLRTEEAILLKMAQSLGAQDNAQQQRYISYLRIFAVNETFQQSIIRTYEAALEGLTTPSGSITQNVMLMLQGSAKNAKASRDIFLTPLAVRLSEVDTFFDDNHTGEGIEPHSSIRVQMAGGQAVSLTPRDQYLSCDQRAIDRFVGNHEEAYLRTDAELPEDARFTLTDAKNESLSLPGDAQITNGQLVITDPSKRSSPLHVSFPLTTKAGYPVEPYGLIEGVRRYPCHAEIVLVVDDTVFHSHLQDKILTGIAVDTFAQQHLPTLVRAYLEKSGGDPTSPLERTKVGRLLVKKRNKSTTQLQYALEGYFETQKLTCPDTAALNKLRQDLQTTPALLMDNREARSRIAGQLNQAAGQVDPHRSSLEIEGGLNLDLYGLDPNTVEAFTVSEDVARKIWENKNPLMRSFAKCPKQAIYTDIPDASIKYGGSNEGMTITKISDNNEKRVVTNTIPNKERHSNNFLHGISHDAATKQVTTSSGDTYELSVQIPAKDFGVINMDVAVARKSVGTPSDPDVQVETGTRFNGTCYATRERLTNNRDLALQGELRNHALCMLEQQVVNHLEQTTGFIMEVMELPGVFDEVAVRARNTLDRGVVIEYAPYDHDDGIVGERESYTYSGIVFDQEHICTTDQKVINMYLAIVRHLTDGTQYKNKIRLMFGEPVETHPSESEVYQWSNKIIEASTPLRLFQDIHSLQNQVNEHNPIGEEKTFTLPNGSSFTLGISNVEKDEKGNDKVVALQIYYIDGEISKLFPNIEELLSDMTMKDKFHLFVQFNEHFMEKFITTYDALPSGYTYAVCDPYTKQLLGMTRQGSVVRYGIITHPETLPPSHVISGNVLFEKGTEHIAKGMLLSHAELFQLIWVKLFEHAKLFEEKQAKAKELIRQEEKQKNEKAKEEEAKLKDALKFKPLKNIWHKIENL